MLPPFIIEQIRQREERERQRRENTSQPRLELPVAPLPARPMSRDVDDDPDRGVVILDLMS
jgi:hypothetical protein